MTRVLLLRCRQPEDAQDCFQSVFLKLFTCKKTFHDDEHIKAWLIRTAIHEAASTNRQFWKRNVLLQGDTPFPEETVSDNSGARELMEEIRTLPEGQRDALYLHCYEGYSIEETAKILNVRPGTVKSRLNRARLTLKSHLKSEEAIYEST